MSDSPDLSDLEISLLCLQTLGHPEMLGSFHVLYVSNLFTFLIAFKARTLEGGGLGSHRWGKGGMNEWR